MPRFKKKPVSVDAFRITEENVNDWRKWPDWAICPHVLCTDSGHVEIETLEGRMRGNVGDWVIQGVNGEVYPCKHGIFVKTYDDQAVVKFDETIEISEELLRELLEECEDWYEEIIITKEDDVDHMFRYEDELFRAEKNEK